MTGFKNNLIRIVFSILVVLSLSSCASRGVGGSKLNPVFVTNSKRVMILPPDFMEGTLDEQQFLEMTFGDQSFALLCYVYADETCIDISLFNDFGGDMGNLYFDGAECTIDSALFPSSLKPEYIVCDLQCAFYNFQALENNFASSKLTFTSEKSENGEIRKIFSGKKLIEQIEIYESDIRIKNFLRGYEYHLIGE